MGESVRCTRGSYLRTLTGGAQNAQVNGDLVNVTMSDGHVKVYDAIRGAYLRTF